MKAGLKTAPKGHATEAGKSHRPARSRSAAALGPPSFQLPPQLGNQAIQQLFRSGALHAKLAVGAPDDPLEKQADQVADRVMRAPAPRLQRKCDCGGPSGASGKCEDCRNKGMEEPGEAAVVRRRATTESPSEAPPIVHETLGGAGRPLDSATRSDMEGRFGADFGDVRIHTGREAAQSARAVGALAYMVGRDIAFGEGQYEPQSDAGRRLLAHELAHVAQEAPRVPLPAATPSTVRRQAADEEDSQLAEQFEEELKTNEENADQENDLMLRAYSSRVVLLLTFLPHKALHTQDDLDTVMQSAYDTAKGEIETIDALRESAEFGLGLRPFGFPLTWAARIQAALSLGIDSVAVMLALIQATTDFALKAAQLSDTILTDGLPVPLGEIDRLTAFRLRLEDAKLEHGGPVSDFARATIRYMQLRYFATFALTWENEVQSLANDVRDGKLQANWFEWKLFVENKQQILRELPDRAMVALATSEDSAQQIETDAIDVTNAAVGLGLSSALIGLLSGILGGWELGVQLFDAQMAIADGKVASAGDGERLAMALRWAYANGYFGAAAMGFVDGLIANGPKILATIAAIVIAQFIPGVDIVLDVYLYFTVARDVVHLIDQLGSALSAAMNAGGVVQLQQAAAALARVLTDGGIQILIVLGAAGIGRAVSKLKTRAAELRDLEPGLSQSEAERRAMKDLSEADRAPLERAQEVEGGGWKKSLSKEDQDFLDRPENAAAKKMWEEMNPTVRQILTRCGSSCIPHNATPAQAAEIEALVDRLGAKGDLIDGLREYFHARRGVLQTAIDDIKGVADEAALRAQLSSARSAVLEGPLDATGALDVDAWVRQLKANGVAGDLDAIAARAKGAGHDAIAARAELRAAARAFSRGEDVEMLTPPSGPGAPTGVKTPEAKLQGASGEARMEVKAATEPPVKTTVNAQVDKAYDQIKRSGKPGEIALDWSETDLGASADFKGASDIERFLNGKMTDGRLRQVRRIDVVWKDASGKTWITSRLRGADGKVGPITTTPL